MKKIIVLISITFLCLNSVLGQMILTYQIPYYSSIVLPLYGDVDVTVNWGDGSSENITTPGNKSHTYNTGTYKVNITGTLTHFGSMSVSQNFLVGVQSWDNIGLTSLSFAFKSASELTSLPAILPESVTDLSYSLYNCSVFNHPIGSWNTKNVTNMGHMFEYCTAFNQPIGNWNTANVNNMESMFFMANSFNQLIGNWNTGNVTNMGGMFSGAGSGTFNQPIGSWNTENVTNMNGMFGNSVFNQPIGNWNTGKLTKTASMFYGAASFNQPINNWNTSNLTDMSSMFQFSAFNQPVGSWNTEKVTNMNSMFEDCPFNHPLNSWNTSNVKLMNHMFYNNSSFNYPLDHWNTSNVTNMSYMFYHSVFNQPIGSWNTVKVETMERMFESSSFNQPIGSWNISSIVNISNMFTGNTLCTSYYDNLLNGWAPQSITSGLQFNGGGSKYSESSKLARGTLINKGWTIFDGGMGTEISPKCVITNLNNELPIVIVKEFDIFISFGSMIIILLNLL